MSYRTVSHINFYVQSISRRISPCVRACDFPCFDLLAPYMTAPAIKSRTPTSQRQLYGVWRYSQETNIEWAIVPKCYLWIGWKRNSDHTNRYSWQCDLKLSWHSAALTILFAHSKRKISILEGISSYMLLSSFEGTTFSFLTPNMAIMMIIDDDD